MLSSRAVDRAVAPLLHPDDERARRHTTPPPRKNQEAYSPRPPIQEKIPGHCSRHADFAHPLTCGVLAGEQCGLAGVPDDHEQSGADRGRLASAEAATACGGSYRIANVAGMHSFAPSSMITRAGSTSDPESGSKFPKLLLVRDRRSRVSHQRRGGSGGLPGWNGGGLIIVLGG